MILRDIAALLELANLETDAAARITPVGGGDISAAWSVPTRRGRVFVKTGPASVADRFAAEAAALNELSQALKVPEVIATVHDDVHTALVLEWLNIGSADAQCEARFGAALAQLHRCTAAAFGWHQDNWIGRTPQPNPSCTDWLEFWRDQRLGFQLRLATQNGFGRDLESRGNRLLDRLDQLLAGHRPEPSLLHGDLWGGNWGQVGDEPVAFDPASYYGDREADLAMTHLFGGFGRRFYDAYENAWPLPDGHERRLPLYMLYHVLNHLNLFGSGYLSRSIAIIDDLLR